ncbi:MAG: hypothetical protein ABW162_07165 [Candidatus Sedimenticola sp. PURPLELP]
MAEYKLKFTDVDDNDSQDDSRQRTLDELHQFIAAMDDRPLAIVTLDEKQSDNWDEEGEIDYQDEYGRQIIEQVSDGITETLLIRSHEGLPVALAARDLASGWQGIGIDKRLRFEIAKSFINDETEFSQ